MVCVSSIINSKHLSTVLFFHIIPARIQWYLWAFQMVHEMAQQNEAVFENKTTTQHKLEKNSRTQWVGGCTRRNSICQHYQLTSIKCEAGSLITCEITLFLFLFLPDFYEYFLFYDTLILLSKLLLSAPRPWDDEFPHLWGRAREEKSGTWKKSWKYRFLI